MEKNIKMKLTQNPQDYLKEMGVTLPDDDTVMVSNRGINVVPLKHGPQEWQDSIEKLEEWYDFTVYHIIYDFYNFGECLTLLFSWNKKSQEEELFSDEPERYEDTCVYAFYAYVVNLTYPTCSEFGSIETYVQDGVLRRIESDSGLLSLFE